MSQARRLVLCRSSSRVSCRLSDASPKRGGRDQRGQNTLEYVGLVVLVAGVLAVLIGTGLAGTFTHRLDCAVRGAFGEPGDDCRDSDSHQSGHRAGARPSKRDPGGPTQGPAPGGSRRDIPILPFPGKGAIEGTAGTSGHGPIISSVTGSVVAERGETTLHLAKGPHGRRTLREQVKLGVTTELKLAAGAGGELGRVGLMLQRSMGGDSTYDVFVTPEQADAIAAGKTTAPHPAVPQEIPVGTKIVLGEEYFHKHGTKGSYRALRLETGIRRGHRASAGIIRVDKDHLRLLVGRSHYVQHLLALSLGLDDVNISFGASRKLNSGRAKQMIIDISTNSGWTAYQDFLRTGKLPDWSPHLSYLSRTARVTTEKYSSVHNIQGNAGPLNISIPSGRNSTTTFTQKLYANGSLDYSLSRRVGDITYVSKQERDSRGHRAGSAYGVLLHGVLSSDLDFYQKGHSANDQEMADAYVTFTEQQLLTIKRRSLRAVATRCRQHSSRCVEGAPTSVPELKRFVQQHPRDLNGVFGPYGDSTALIKAAARADEPADILAAAHRISNGNPSAFLHLMTKFGTRTHDILGSADKPSGDDYKNYFPGDVVIRRPGG